MSTKRIADYQWQKLYAFLQGHPRVYAGQEDEYHCGGMPEALKNVPEAGSGHAVGSNAESSTMRVSLAARSTAPSCSAR